VVEYQGLGDVHLVARGSLMRPLLNGGMLARPGGLRLSDLTELTRAHIRALFRPSDVETAERVLASRCGRGLPGLGGRATGNLERSQSAAVRVSAGRLQDLNEAIALAELDWRDLLVAADFAEDPSAHTRWQPRAFDDEVLNHWLAGGAVPGVAFSHNELVTVTAPLSEARPASVISLEALEPEPRYLVELSSGADLMAFQRHLNRID